MKKKIILLSILTIILASAFTTNAESLSIDNPLSPEEIEGLLLMREEEKLAHDVYTLFYELWGAPIFNNIARSEQAHTDAVLTLLETYEMDDPAAGQPEGHFTNPELQSLYDQLIEQGSQSVLDAFIVGAAIEEIDILDLESLLDENPQSDIQLVYENLLRGSFNHLRSFVRNIETQSEGNYVPQYMDTDSYEEILSTPNSRGGRQSESFGNRGAGRGRR